jgi:hypothetical protein
MMILNVAGHILKIKTTDPEDHQSARRAGAFEPKGAASSQITYSHG